jgi:hypothetical protein
MKPNPAGVLVGAMEDHRRFYANYVVKSVGSSNEKLIDAFASTERGHYLGAGPWSVL